MTSALVGARGFVGGNLARQRAFDDLFDSSNSRQMIGRTYDLVVFAAARAEKWRANADPDADRRHIEDLKTLIRGVTARELVLISTIDVYPVARDVDERAPITTRSSPYGAHRLELEDVVREVCPKHLIVRLPGLFGPGLKKNVIYDFINANQVEKIDSRGRFQFYNLNHLWADIEKARALDLRLINMSVEPVSVAEVSSAAFGKTFENHVLPAPAVYDFKSVHDRAWGGANGYLYSKDQTLDEMKTFVREGAHA